jgi:hypothetical protein
MNAFGQEWQVSTFDPKTLPDAFSQPASAPPTPRQPACCAVKAFSESSVDGYLEGLWDGGERNGMTVFDVLTTVIFISHGGFS